MREACLLYKLKFCSNIFENLQGINEMNIFEFFWGDVVVMSPPDGGTHLEWGLEGRGMRALPQILSDESLSYSFPVFMMTSSNGNMFRVTGFCAANSPVTAGNSPVTSEFPSHRPVTRSFDVFFDLRTKKRLSKQSRRRWFRTPSRSLWRHCNAVPNSDPVIRAAVGFFGVQRITLVQFWIGETGQIWGIRALWKEWPQN